MQELSKTSFPRSRANDENSDNLSYLIEKKLEILSRLKTESASLEQLINTPSQENKVTELEQQIEDPAAIASYLYTGFQGLNVVAKSGKSIEELKVVVEQILLRLPRKSDLK